MIKIRFSDHELKRRALGKLARRYPFKSLASGDMLVPEAALWFLAVEGISFRVEGPATSEQDTPSIRSVATAQLE
jgi:hypothetical protein